MMRQTLLATAVLFAMTAYAINENAEGFESTDYLEIGKLIFPERAEVLTGFFESFRSDKEGFLKRNEELIDSYGFERMTEFHLLYVIGDTEELLGFIDWRGEENERELEEFVDGQLGAGIVAWSATNKLRSSSKDIDQNDGTFIIKLFKSIDNDLREVGKTLLFFDMGSDSYSFTIVSVEAYDKVRSMAHGQFMAASELKE